MPAHRKPSVVLERAGAFAKNPKRRRKAVAGRGDLPATPPRHLRSIKGATAAWKELVAAIPAGVATGSDRFAVERCAILLAQSRQPGFLAANEGHLRAYMGALGLTAAARERLAGTGGEQPQNGFGAVGAPVTPIGGRRGA